MLNHIDYVVLIREMFYILRISQSGDKFLSVQHFDRPELAAKAIRQHQQGEFRIVDEATASMLGEPYFYANTNRYGHIWHIDKLLCGEKNIKSGVVFSHHRPKFLCVNCIQNLKHNKSLFNNVFDYETQKYTGKDPSNKTSLKTKKLEYSDTYTYPDETKLKNGILLFWSDKFPDCIISRRKKWPIFIMQNLNKILAGNEVGMPPGMIKFMTKIRDLDIPFKDIRLTILDEFESDDDRYQKADKIWNTLLRLENFIPFQRQYASCFLTKEGDNYWVPKSKIDLSEVKNKSKSLSEWQQFFYDKNWIKKVPLPIGCFDKFDPNNSHIDNQDSDIYILKDEDILTAFSNDEKYYLKLNTSSDEYTNKYTMASLQSAYTMLITIRKKGVIRLEHWEKVDEF